jgi:hypothetical protein
MNLSLYCLQAKLAFERLQIPHIYHPFICGPNNALVDKLKDETGAKIHIPPSVLNKDEIVVSGDKDGVMRAKETIMKIYQEKVHFLCHDRHLDTL